MARRRARQRLLLVTLVGVVLVGGISFSRYRALSRARKQLEVAHLRNHIARDLHDDIGSTLSSIHVLAQMAQRTAPEPSRHVLAKISTHTATTMERLGDLVWSIHPKNDGLEHMLIKMREFAVERLEPLDITFDFRVAPAVQRVQMNAETRRHIFLIFKEAVHNAAKYSRTPHLEIGLDVAEGTLQLQVRDHGQGFEVARAGRGNGLQNMRERAQAIGAHLSISSQPNVGTAILLRTAIS